MALDIYDQALEATGVHLGEEYPKPELGSALKAVELAGKLLGHLGDGRNLSIDQLKTELDKAGYELRPKALKAVKP